MQTGDEALAGRDEVNITHYFPPDNTKGRKIWFKGYYLSIYNKQTEDYKTYIVNKIPTTIYKGYEVPIGYTVYIRVAIIKFEV